MNNSRTIWREWTLMTAVGEFFGFAVPTAAGLFAVWLTARMEPLLGGVLFYLIVVLSGFGEGALFSFFQSLVLRKYFPELSIKDFVLYTGLAAVLAWAIGMLPSTIGENLTKVPMFLLILGGVVAGLFFLLSIGYAQWLVLRRHLKNAGVWILANAIAWPLGVLLSIIILSIVPDKSPMVVWVISGILAGVAMGLTVGAITGFFLTKLLSSVPSS